MPTKKEGPVTAILNGAGLRGRLIYGGYAQKHPDRLKFVAIADPNVDRRRLFQKEHNIPDTMAFNSWDEMMNEKIGKIADTAFICTQDQMHFEPAMRALDIGYDLLLEKPITPNLEQCRAITKKAVEKKRFVQVSHVLRFTEYWQKVKEVIDSGQLGKIIHIDHSENVSYWHMGHSFVRGPYRNKSTSSPMILAKCCHDLDLLYWFMGEKATDLQSTGRLTYYVPENAPKGSPDRCTDGCPVEKECPWNAVRMYVYGEPLIRIGLHAPSRFMRGFTDYILKHKGFGRFLALFSKNAENFIDWRDYPTTALTTDVSMEGKMKALREGPWGKCIYKCGNDVVDHHITTFNFPSGATATLTMHGVSDQEGRELRIFGSKATLRGYFRQSGEYLEITDFRYNKTIPIFQKGLTLDGHGGGDYLLMDAFTAVLKGEKTAQQAGTTEIAGAMESHYMAFASEDARISGKTLQMADYR